MRSFAILVYLVIGLLAGARAWTEQWFNVTGPGQEQERATVEVDIDTVRMRGQTGEGAIRVTFNAPHPHASGFSFRSFLANAQFDCQHRLVTLNSAAYYSQPSAQGQRLAVESAGEEAGMTSGLVESIPAAARQSLLKAACATTTQTSAA
jgi:hypothetical protein